MARYDHETTKKLVQHSMFLTAEQFNHTLRLHLQKHKLHPTARKIFDYLGKHAIKFLGVAYLKVKTIAEALEISEATAKRYLSLFVKLGIIARIPQMRKKQGGKGASMYAFQPCEPSQMNHRQESKKQDGTRTETGNSETEATVFLNQSKDLNTYNVKRDSSNQTTVVIHLDNTFWNKVPVNVPTEFTDAVRRLFTNGKTIFELWGKVELVKKQEGLRSATSLLPYAIEAFECLFEAMKRDKRNNKWDQKRIYGYFYVAVREAFNNSMRELASGL